MPNYRRAFVPGGCWFFTVNLLDRQRRLLTDHIDALREAARVTQSRHPFTIDAMVVLPDHIHAVRRAGGAISGGLGWRRLGRGQLRRACLRWGGRVGEDVSTLAPHRPGRADFPHPVLHGRALLRAAYRWTTRGLGSE